MCLYLCLYLPSLWSYHSLVTPVNWITILDPQSHSPIKGCRAPLNQRKTYWSTTQVVCAWLEDMPGCNSPQIPVLQSKKDLVVLLAHEHTNQVLQLSAKIDEKEAVRQWLLSEFSWKAVAVFVRQRDREDREDRENIILNDILQMNNEPAQGYMQLICMSVLMAKRLLSPSTRT